LQWRNGNGEVAQDVQSCVTEPAPQLLAKLTLSAHW